MKFLFFIFSFLYSVLVFSQSSISEVLKKSNKNTVPYIKVKDLKLSADFVLLDTREFKEYNVSHIYNAINVGFDKFDKKQIKTIVKDKNKPIIVYCSIGIRSEKTGEKLLKMGYTNVKNLYGGIFEWKNTGNSVVGNDNKVTDNVHAFSKEWSIYLTSGTVIYEK
jgi:rhodanese-related sulfurtransferase